ncbi:hypothetical protein [Manganibacter manganicus]|uniref:hypothetical protein n=1 Tax=Manganibacter manganicus TaxID=1873176 RepID=UPI00178CEB9A|nr:hypothetical protein [Pseudaminobacter manganicus]
MIRLLFVVLIAIAIWLILSRLLRWARGAAIDWTGVTFAVGFIAIAFWLRHITGIG